MLSMRSSLNSSNPKLSAELNGRNFRWPHAASGPSVCQSDVSATKRKSGPVCGYVTYVRPTGTRQWARAGCELRPNSMRPAAVARGSQPHVGPRATVGTVVASPTPVRWWRRRRGRAGGGAATLRARPPLACPIRLRRRRHCRRCELLALNAGRRTKDPADVKGRVIHNAPRTVAGARLEPRTQQPSSCRKSFVGLLIDSRQWYDAIVGSAPMRMQPPAHLRDFQRPAGSKAPHPLENRQADPRKRSAHPNNVIYPSPIGATHSLALKILSYQHETSLDWERL